MSATHKGHRNRNDNNRGNLSQNTEFRSQSKPIDDPSP
jgi:hypothetical protein